MPGNVRLDKSWQEGDYCVTDTEWHPTSEAAAVRRRQLLADLSWLAQLAKGAPTKNLTIDIHGPETLSYRSEQPFDAGAFGRFLAEANNALEKPNLSGDV